MAQPQVALLGRRLMAAAAVGLVGAHLLDFDAECAHAGQRLPSLSNRACLSAIFRRMEVNALIVSLVDPDGFIAALER
jgi:hypothetical protein